MGAGGGGDWEWERRGKRGLKLCRWLAEADVCVVHAASLRDADGGTAGADDLGEGGVFDVGG